MDVASILLVEGHGFMRSAVKDLLRHNGMDSIAVSDPIQAVGQVKQSAPAVIILDTTWSEVNGLWLTRLLRQLAPQSKILLLLDDSRQDYQDAAQFNGADACIAKATVSKDLMPMLWLWAQEA